MNATADQKTPSNSFDPTQYATRVPRDVDPPRSPAPAEERAFRPPATSITDTTLDIKIETATDDSSQPLEPETTEEAEPDKRWVVLTAIGRVAAAAGAAAFVALLFVIVIPSLRQQSAETSSAAAAIDSLKAAMSRAEQSKLQDAKPSPELQSILASSETNPPVTHQESEELLKQFMQWQQKPADTQENNDGNSDRNGDQK
jgi:hypothetical protein